MANEDIETLVASVGSWAKRCHLAGRAAMEDALRPHGLGATQYYVLHRLVHQGPTLQRDLQRFLHVERATLSVVVTVLVRKGLVEQLAAGGDQRQKLLQMTPLGMRLWGELPDLSRIQQVAFAGMDPADLATTIAVLRSATERLLDSPDRRDDT